MGPHITWTAKQNRAAGYRRSGGLAQQVGQRDIFGHADRLGAGAGGYARFDDLGFREHAGQAVADHLAALRERFQDHRFERGGVAGQRLGQAKGGSAARAVRIAAGPGARQRAHCAAAQRNGPDDGVVGVDDDDDDENMDEELAAMPSNEEEAEFWVKETKKK